MVNLILVQHFSDIWSFRLYGQLYQDKTVDHISETQCTKLQLQYGLTHLVSRKVLLNVFKNFLMQSTEFPIPR